MFDTQGSAIQANPALSNLINVPLNNILATTVNDLVEASPMDAKNRGTLAGVLTKPGRQHTSHRVEWGKKTLSISSGQVLDHDGSEVGTVAVFRDFTREAEVERMKSAFVAMVSHELRTPLSAILGYAEIFMEQIYGPLNEKQVNMTNRIVSNTRRLLSLINDLLDQAQMEAGKLKIKYETIKPADLLENLHSVMEKLTADKSLKLTSELDPKAARNAHRGWRSLTTNPCQSGQQCRQIHGRWRHSCPICQAGRAALEHHSFGYGTGYSKRRITAYL